MTYGEVLRYGAGYLKDCSVPDPETDAWYLLEYCCGFSRAEYLLKKTQPMEVPLFLAYQKLLMERGRRIPLQHITGEQKFMGFAFRVNSSVLIPRQDTEILVEEALRRLKSGDKVLDLCTGSGCIAVSMKKLFPGLEMTASDCSGDALAVADDNAAKHGAEVRFVRSDLFENLTGSWNMIVSNPPYIPTGVIEDLAEEVRLHDPRIALDGGADGLDFYRKIVTESPAYLQKGGWLFLEIGFDQGTPVSGMLQDRGFSDIRIIKDLAGLDRVVAGCLS